MHSTTHYVMASRLVGEGYSERDIKRRTLMVERPGGQYGPAQTEEEVLKAVRRYLASQFVNVVPEVLRVTKVTTTTEYDDITDSVLSTLDTATTDL